MKLIKAIVMYFLLTCILHGSEEFVHDPSRFFLFDERLIGYSSGSNGVALQGLELVLQEELVEHFVPVFEEGVPGWIDDIQIWNKTYELDAPAVHQNGKYIFYTVTDETDDQDSAYNIQDAIGVVKNNGTPDEPDWLDLGIVVQSRGEQLGTARAMDPSILEFKQNLYLIFGSHAGGIYLTELNPESMKLKKKPQLTSTLKHKNRFFHLAQHLDSNKEESEIEAPFLYRKGNYFYLFVNWGKCCRGVDSTYNIRVGRSRSIKGPFFDKAGKSMNSGGGSLFLQSKEHYSGPGHAGIAITNNYGEVFTYHYYDAEDNGISKLAARELLWTETGWPKLGKHLVSINKN